MLPKFLSSLVFMPSLLLQYYFTDLGFKSVHKPRSSFETVRGHKIRPFEHPFCLMCKASLSEIVWNCFGFFIANSAKVLHCIHQIHRLRLRYVVEASLNLDINYIHIISFQDLNYILIYQKAWETQAWLCFSIFNNSFLCIF